MTMRLVLFGATGFVGNAILREARWRDHQVLAIARRTEQCGEPSRTGSVHDADFVREVAADADAVLVAVPARPAEDGSTLANTVPTLAEAVRRSGARLGVVGGAGGLLVGETGPRLVDTPEFPEQAKPEAAGQLEVLEALRESPAEVDWFYLSPAASFGAHVAGERTGGYRLGTDVLVTDADGHSAISGADYAIAFVDELENPTHRRQRFAVGY